MATTLYYASGSCSLAVHWALVEAGWTFDLVPVKLAAGEQRTPEFLAINPHGRVPVLSVEGRSITELPAILYHIASAAPDARLLPFDDGRAMARALECLAWFSSSVQVSFSQIFRPDRFTDSDETKESLKRDGRPRVLAQFDEIEALIASQGPWLLGERFSVLDPYALVFLNWAARLEIDATDYPAWHSHACRLLRRPSAAKLLAAEDWNPTIPGLKIAA